MSGSRPDPDPNLIGRAQGGDREALRGLLEEVSPAVRQWALAATGDPEDAADLAQEVLIIVVRKLQYYEGRSRFLTWLFSITRNQAIEAGRRATRHRMKMERVSAQGMEWRSEGNMSETLDRRRISDVVSAFLRELPDRQREIFQLFELQGLSSPEIADILNVEPGTVRAALFKARRTLRRKILRDHPEFAEEYLS